MYAHVVWRSCRMSPMEFPYWIRVASQECPVPPVILHDSTMAAIRQMWDDHDPLCESGANLYNVSTTIVNHP